MKSDPVIHASRLRRVYTLGESQVVGLAGVDLAIDAGALVVLKGVSGSGKSTLLALIAGLDRPSAGRLVVAGRDLAGASEADLTVFRREVVGMVFQNFNLLPTLSVLENVSLPGLLAGRPRAETLRRADELLAWLGMTARRHHFPAQLSGGEMQRTAIARALINDPPIILADEPTGNLDSGNGAVVVQLLADLNRRWQRTVIIATHSTIADPYATVRILLKDGAIADGSWAD
ncbi:MAG TPA: ABC transporter ATP-binding protein [Desulfobacteraceae bacterium]|nr:ABC transporter ATP-binding protein [Deltaproteobacteria bacterium]MBW2355963.1 ABC transporter ATP-binding protein [Deltaproteobacteria bacterium]HDI60394.1 ABC transporter ATP-binding protein [Desulfobacteraceae bacterium]